MKNKLPKEVLVGWFGTNDNRFLSASEQPEDLLAIDDVNKITCGRYVLKEEVVITRETHVQVKAKRK